MNLNQISFGMKPAGVPDHEWIKRFLEVGIRIAQVSTRFAGHCYSTTYNYPCVEEARLRKNGSIRWEKTSQWGRRTYNGGYGPGHLPDAGKLLTGATQYGIPIALES